MIRVKPILLALAFVALPFPASADDPCQAALDEVLAAGSANVDGIMDRRMALAIENALRDCPDDAPTSDRTEERNPLDAVFMPDVPGRSDTNQCQREPVTMEHVAMQYAVLVAGQLVGPFTNVGRGTASWDGSHHEMTAGDSLGNGFWGRSDGSGALILFGQRVDEAFGNAQTGCAGFGGRVCWANGYAAARMSSPTFAIAVSGLWKQGACLAL